MNLTLSSVAADLLDTLTRRVRLISLAQLKELWQISARNRRVLRRRVSRLHAAHLLDVHAINVQILNPAGPLFAWRPGGEEPDAEALARHSQMRWQSTAAPTTVCVASRLAANLFGSTSADSRSSNIGITTCCWPQSTSSTACDVRTRPRCGSANTRSPKRASRSKTRMRF